MANTESSQVYTEGERSIAPPISIIKRPNTLLHLESLYKTFPEITTEPTTHIQLRLSELEEIYPWLLDMYNIPHVSNTEYPFDASHKTTTRGIKLHHLDSLLDCSFASLHNQQRVRDIFPTLHHDDYINTIQKIVDSTMINGMNSPQGYSYEGLQEAWNMIHTDLSSDAAGSLPMFEELKMNNPEAIKLYWNDNAILPHGYPLIRAWEHIFNGTDTRHMMGNPQVKRYREVSVILNLQCGIQLQIRFDAIYALRTNNGSVFVSGVDMKSAKQMPTNAMELEIFYRQGQLMKYALEVFRRRFLLEHDLKPIGKGYTMFTNHHSFSTKDIPFSAFYFRRFHTEVMPDYFTYERLLFEEYERAEFVSWLDWLAQAMHTEEKKTKTFLRHHRSKQKQGKEKKKRSGGGKQKKNNYNNPDAYDRTLL